MLALAVWTKSALLSSGLTERTQSRWDVRLRRLERARGGVEHDRVARADRDRLHEAVGATGRVVDLVVRARVVERAVERRRGADVVEEAVGVGEGRAGRALHARVAHRLLRLDVRGGVGVGPRRRHRVDRAADVEVVDRLFRGDDRTRLGVEEVGDAERLHVRGQVHHRHAPGELRRARLGRVDLRDHQTRLLADGADDALVELELRDAAQRGLVRDERRQGVEPGDARQGARLDREQLAPRAEQHVDEAAFDRHAADRLAELDRQLVARADHAEREELRALLDQRRLLDAVQVLRGRERLAGEREPVGLAQGLEGRRDLATEQELGATGALIEVDLPVRAVLGLPLREGGLGAGSLLGVREAERNAGQGDEGSQIALLHGWSHSGESGMSASGRTAGARGNRTASGHPDRRPASVLGRAEPPGGFPTLRGFGSSGRWPTPECTLLPTPPGTGRSAPALAPRKFLPEVRAPAKRKPLRDLTGESARSVGAPTAPRPRLRRGALRRAPSASRSSC